MIEIPVSAQQSRAIADKVYQENLKQDDENLFYRICKVINDNCEEGKFVANVVISLKQIDAFKKKTKKTFKNMGYKVKITPRYNSYNDIVDYLATIRW